MTDPNKHEGAIKLDMPPDDELMERLFEHRRMYAALLEIKRLYEKENGKFDKQVYVDDRAVWNIACRGLGK